MKKFRKIAASTAVVALCLLGFVSIKPYVRSRTMALFNPPDGIDIKFAHAVNTEAKLNASLSDSTVMVLEADVLNDPVKNIPIVAHPPAITSDISLAQFLARVVLHPTPKGIKLDFKEMEVVEPSLKILAAFQEKYQSIPVILNADILVGPENPPNIPLNANRFLEACSSYGQNNMLSLGWTTTNAGDKNYPQGYTWEMVLEMYKIVKHLKQRITFPVRASLVAVSRDQLLWLLSHDSDYSLTIWHSMADVYDVKGMKFLRSRKYIGKIYYDLPDEKIKELKSIPVT